MKIAVISITRHGVELGGRVVEALPGARLFAPEKFRSEAELAAPGHRNIMQGRLATSWAHCLPLTMRLSSFFSLGAVVRLSEPYLKSKDVDPAIVVLDEGGKFAIPMLYGHLRWGQRTGWASGHGAWRNPRADHGFGFVRNDRRQPAGS